MAVSATLAINEEIARRRSAGLPVLPLGFGEAGLPVHPLLVAELRGAAGSAGYGPVAGIPELREAAAGYWDRRHLPTDPAQVVAGPGSKPLLWAILGARTGDVVLPRPSWVSYASQLALHGRRCHRIDIRPGEGGVPDPGALAALARRGGISTVVVTLPDNPTGTLASPATVRELCAVADEHDLLVISDEIYRDLLHDPATAYLSPAEVVPSRVVITTGPSKSLALGGWRIGVARFPDDGLRDTVIDTASEVWSAPARPVQAAAALGFGEPTALLDRVAASRRLHAQVAAAVADIVGSPPPAGGFYLYPQLTRHAAGAASDTDLTQRLLQRDGVAVLPGSAFGDDPQRRRVRVATSGLYGETDDRRQEALDCADPTTLPWIADHLDRLRRILGQ